MKKNISIHAAQERTERLEFISTVIGKGKAVKAVTVDRGHENGAEIHVVTSTAIILIYNASSKKFITALIAREGQLRRYYKGEPVPQELVKLARQHEGAGYNNL